jgi:hypothetical protein
MLLQRHAERAPTLAVPDVVATLRVRGAKTMYTDSVKREAGLPQEGQSVEFILEGREVAMDGTYAERTFRSHWSDYAIDRVRSWRPADFHSPDLDSAHDMEFQRHRGQTRIP